MLMMLGGTAKKQEGADADDAGWHWTRTALVLMTLAGTGERDSADADDTGRPQKGEGADADDAGRY